MAISIKPSYRLKKTKKRKLSIAGFTRPDLRPMIGLEPDEKISSGHPINCLHADDILNAVIFHKIYFADFSSLVSIKSL